MKGGCGKRDRKRKMEDGRGRGGEGCCEGVWPWMYRVNSPEHDTSFL